MAGKEQHLSVLFSALSDPTRRAILSRLAHEGEATISDLARPFTMSLPAISKHIRVLEQAGLLEREVRGREHRCRLQPRPLKDAVDWLAEYRQYWEGRLDALARYLESSPED
jgi:DNA-binding transcriptional ArsR family regulator